MGLDRAQRGAAEVERRTLAAPPVLPSGSSALLAEIRKCLVSAADEGVLSTAPHRVFGLLKVKEEQDADRAIFVTVWGGETMDKGQATGEFFYRQDGARISFGITLSYGRGSGPMLVGYRFHLRFSDAVSPAYVRFDLDREPSDALLEPRCHVHPGTDDLRVPAPLMGPVEILEKLLYGMPGVLKA